MPAQPRALPRVRSQRRTRILFLTAWYVLAAVGRAQPDLWIYTDHLLNGFQDWSWATRDLTNSTPVHTGTHSIRVEAAAWEALSLHHNDFDSSSYMALRFWVYGGGRAGQQLQVRAILSGKEQAPFVLPPLARGEWAEISLPLESLGASDRSDVEGFWIQRRSGGSSEPFFVDDIRLEAKALPATAHLVVEAAQVLRRADARWFGVNAAVWDRYFSAPETLQALREMGCRALRFPGGSLSDDYHWASNRSDDNSWEWTTSFWDFASVATNLGAQVFLTVNYGSGTAQEAAAWVRCANVTNRFGFRYWEIGNENYGSWETDQTAHPHDPYTYATRAAEYLKEMKAADPGIQVGVVVVPGEDSYDNGYRGHPAVNLRTGETHYGWTPVLLSTLRKEGVTPAFVVYHWYPEYTDQESDALLLQSSSEWARAAADLRGQIRDYFGTGGTNIELVCTENNSNSGAQGKQSTSLINGLYLADSLGRLMTTEFNAFLWWDLRNGRDTNGNMDPTLYGWRNYGDLGMIEGLTNRHPTFYAMKLLHDFVQPGDEILKPSSDHPLLAVYASRRTNGSLGLLIINKAPENTLEGRVRLTGFHPAPAGVAQSYGIPQDDAARTGIGSPDIVFESFPSAGTNFSYSFPPLSLTLVTLAPQAPRLAVIAPPSGDGEGIVFELQGEPATPYVLQTATELGQWTAVSTNTLSGGGLRFTNEIPTGAGARFWRAVWVP